MAIDSQLYYFFFAAAAADCGGGGASGHSPVMVLHLVGTISNRASGRMRRRRWFVMMLTVRRKGGGEEGRRGAAGGAGPFVDVRVRLSISSARGQQKRASKQQGCWPKKLGIVVRTVGPVGTRALSAPQSLGCIWGVSCEAGSAKRVVRLWTISLWAWCILARTGVAGVRWLSELRSHERRTKRRASE